MKKVFAILISCLMLIGNVFAYTSYDYVENDNIGYKVVDYSGMSHNIYIVDLIAKYMGFNIDSSNFSFDNNYGFGMISAVDLNKSFYSQNMYYGGAFHNVNVGSLSNVDLSSNILSKQQVLKIEKDLINIWRNYITNGNKLDVFENGVFLGNLNRIVLNYDNVDLNVTSSLLTINGKQFERNTSVFNRYINNIEYSIQCFNYYCYLIPSNLNGNNYGGISVPLIKYGATSSSIYFCQNYVNNSWYNILIDGGIININNNSNLALKLFNVTNNTYNNLMADNFFNYNNYDTSYDNDTHLVVGIFNDNVNGLSYIKNYNKQNLVPSYKEINNKYVYPYLFTNVNTYKVNFENLIDYNDLDPFVSNVNIVNMSDEELLNLIPFNDNDVFDVNDILSEYPSITDMLAISNNDLPNYNGGSSGGGGGSEEPTPSTPSDTDYDYGLTEEQETILNENTALGTIGKILAKGFEFVATPLAKGTQALNDWLKKLLGATEDAPMNLWNFFKSGFNNLRGGLNSITQSISNIASDLWNSFKSGFDSLGGFIDDVAKGLQSQIDVLSQGLSDITEAIGNITQNIITNITNVFSDVVDVINGLALGFWDYFKNGFQWIKDSIDALTSQVLASLTNLGSSISNALGNIWNGFINLFTIPEGDTFIDDGLSELNTLVSNKWNFDDLTGFLNILKNGSVQNNVLNDEYISMPELLGGNSAKIIDYSFIRNNIETIRNLQRFGLYSVMALNIKDCISGVIRNDS